MSKPNGFPRLKISTHLKICISCSLVFLSQKSQCYFNSLENKIISKVQTQCLCNKTEVQISKLTWPEFLHELSSDSFVGLGTQNVFTKYKHSIVVNISSTNDYYLIPYGTSENKINVADSGIISKFTRSNNKFCQFSEACKSNLENKELRVAGVISEEYAYDTAIRKTTDGSYIFEDSFSVELLKCLELTLNFTTIPIGTAFWGHLLPNNTWTGMIALLLSNEVDLGLSSIADRPFRREVVDFNIPTNEIRLAAFFKKPSSISSEFVALLKPFQTEFWLAVFFMTIGTASTIFVINKVLNKSNQSDPFKLNKANAKVTDLFPMSEISQRQNEDLSLSADSYWSGMDCIQWSASTICLQGFYKVPSDISFRIGMIVGSLSGFVVYSAYAGTLVSFLSVVTEPIQNLGQLVSTEFTFVVVDEPLALKFLADSPDSRNVMVYQRRNTERSYSSMTEAYQKIVQGSFAFVTDHIGAYESLTNDFSVEEACLVREIAIDNAEQKQGTIVRKDSPYKRVIDYQILRMIQYGLVRRWNSKYLKSKMACDNQSSYEGVELGSVVIAFLIVGGGILLGIFVILLEILCYRMIQGKRGILPIIILS